MPCTIIPPPPPLIIQQHPPSSQQPINVGLAGAVGMLGMTASVFCLGISAGVSVLADGFFENNKPVNRMLERFANRGVGVGGVCLVVGLVSLGAQGIIAVAKHS